MRLLAVGDRQPGWVDAAFAEYTARLPRQWRFRLETVAAARRTPGAPPGRALESESGQLLDRVGSDEHLVLLDERGTQMSSKALADRVAAWQSGGRDVAFVIGGPDGVSAACRGRADLVWSLSELTLPHGLARVLLAEQLYRAWSLLSGHPYHRS